MKTYKIYETEKVKSLISDDYNFLFDKINGYFARWGKTFDDDPKWSPFGPEILDLELGEICHGTDLGLCKSCYKSNTPKGKVMSFETFKSIIDKMPKTLTQIAMGIGDIDSIPDLEKIFVYTHEKGIIPNITINGYRMTDYYFEILTKYCGGIAVSLYDDKDICYNTIKRFSEMGVKQLNIHQIVSEEELQKCHQLIEDAANDQRLKNNLKAIVFLTLKPKGKRNGMNIVKDVAKYKGLIDHAFDVGVQIGFDSCSAPIFLQAMKYDKNFDKYVKMVESCESTKFSAYCNVEGVFWPCSFTEDEIGFTGVSILKSTDFIKDVWNNKDVKYFRDMLLLQDNSHICHDCQLCPVFSLYDEVLIGDGSNGRERKLNMFNKISQRK